MERHSIKKPKISVVIPAHNEENVLTFTLEALLKQTHPNFEIVIVNNASTDKTVEVVTNFISSRKLGQEKIRIVHESKKGLLHARERGRREARGIIVANIDADCLPEADWLEKASALFDTSAGGIQRADGATKIVGVSGPYDYYDAHPSFKFSSMIMQNYIYRPVSHILQWPFVRTYMGGGAVLIGGNNLIRADILEKMGGYNTKLTFYGEDTDTAKRIAKFGRVIFTPKLPMKTSARRFKDEGTLKLTVWYLFHFFKHTFKGI